MLFYLGFSSRHRVFDNPARLKPVKDKTLLKVHAHWCRQNPDKILWTNIKIYLFKEVAFGYCYSDLI